MGIREFISLDPLLPYVCVCIRSISLLRAKQYDGLKSLYHVCFWIGQSKELTMSAGEV